MGLGCPGVPKIFCFVRSVIKHWESPSESGLSGIVMKKALSSGSTPGRTSIGLKVL